MKVFDSSFCLSLLFFLGRTTFTKSDDPNQGDEINLSTVGMCRLRKFDCQDHYVKTSYKSTINLVQMKNPAIGDGNGRLPKKKSILFVHGILASTDYFITGSVDVRPKDLSQLKISDMSEESLASALHDEPSVQSLPFLLSNTGYDVWLMNRRPTMRSQAASGQEKLASWHLNETRRSPPGGPGFDYPFRETNGSIVETLINQLEYNLLVDLNPYVALETFNLDYWDFSMDEQALIDLPKIIDYILEHDNRSELCIVGHSLGGALPVMLQSEKVEYQKKIGRTILFAPALETVRDMSLFIMAVKALEPLVATLLGPLPLPQMSPAIATIVGDFCAADVTDDIICTPIEDAILGEGSNENVMRVGSWKALFNVASSHEVLHLIQTLKKRRISKLDYRIPILNYIHYGTFEPPVYPLERVNGSRILIWYGNTDGLVDPDNAGLLVGMFGTPPTLRFLDQSGLHFNHLSYQRHMNVGQLVNIPSLKYMEMA